MSHFAVLVIGEDVEGQLAPYHEFECTGQNDEFVQDLNITEEARKEFEGDTTDRLRCPEGVLHYPYEDRFYRDPTPEEVKTIGPFAGSGGGGGIMWASKDWGDGLGYRTKVYERPAGFEAVGIPTRELKTFAEFVADYHGYSAVAFGATPDIEGPHKYGYYRTDSDGAVVEVVNRTNPNAKWDWYVTGGRWTGFWILKHGASGEVGRPGLMTEPAGPGRADSARKGDIDFATMRADAGAKAGILWDRVHAVITGRPVKLWADVRADHEGDIEAARETYHGQPVIVDLRGSTDDDLRWLMAEELERLLVSREEYVARAEREAIQTFAVLKDGKWHERGGMGWWGVVHDEKDRDAWSREFKELIDGLSGDTLLTIVDCHI